MATSRYPPLDLPIDPVSAPGLFGTAFQLDLAKLEVGAWGDVGAWFAVARDAGIPVAVCEAAVGRDLPTYPERRLWRAALPWPFRRGTLVFTDSARLSFVWGWTDWGGDGVGGGRYVEHRLPGREATLERGLRSWSHRDRHAPPTVTGDEGPAIELLRALRRRCPRIPSTAVDAPSAFQRYVEECGDLEALRGVWRVTRQFRALDLGSPDSGWLLSIGRTLEAVLLALIERMRVWVDDQRGTPRRRPEYLRDFRQVIEQAEGPQWEFDRRRYVRRLVAQQHLFAATGAGQSHDRWRASLLGFAGVDDASAELLACNVCDLQLMPPRPPLTRPARSAGRRSSSSAAACGADVDILRRAWCAVRSAELLKYGATAEVARAGRQIEARRRDLLRPEQGGRGSGAVGQDGAWPLLFCGVAGWEDFDLIHSP